MSNRLRFSLAIVALPVSGAWKNLARILGQVKSFRKLQGFWQQHYPVELYFNG